MGGRRSSAMSLSMMQDDCPPAGPRHPRRLSRAPRRVGDDRQDRMEDHLIEGQEIGRLQDAWRTTPDEGDGSDAILARPPGEERLAELDRFDRVQSADKDIKTRSGSPPAKPTLATRRCMPTAGTSPSPGVRHSR